MDDCFPWEDDLYEMGVNESWQDSSTGMNDPDDDDEDDYDDDYEDDEDDEDDDEDIVDRADRLFARINDLPDEPRADND